MRIFRVYEFYNDTAFPFFFLRTNLHEQFLENQILEAIKLWLEPLPDGSLPSLDIQNDMLDILAKVSDTALVIR